MRKLSTSKNNKGFSLTELIVVVAIMAVMIVILAPVMLRYVEKSRTQKDESALSEVARAAEIAMATETVMTSIQGTPDIILTITESGITDDATYVHGTLGSLLADEVKKTIGNGVHFSSKTYQSEAAIAYVKLTYDSGKGTYVFAKTSDGNPYSKTVADLNTY